MVIAIFDFAAFFLPGINLILPRKTAKHLFCRFFGVIFEPFMFFNVLDAPRHNRP